MITNRGAEVSGIRYTASSAKKSMAAFDALPRELRDATNEAAGKISPISIAKALRAGVSVERALQLLKKTDSVFIQNAYLERGFHNTISSVSPKAPQAADEKAVPPFNKCGTASFSSEGRR